MTDLDTGAVLVNGTTADATALNSKFSAIEAIVNTTGVPKLQSNAVVTASITDAAVTRSKITAAERIPTGVMMDYAATTAPTGWLLCDGSAVSRTTYADLFTLIGTAFGAGNGSTTFNLPDLRGRVAVGLDNLGGTAASRVSGGTTLGGSGGTQSANLAINELPVHEHDMAAGTATSGGSHYHTFTTAEATNTTTGGSGGRVVDVSTSSNGTNVNTQSSGTHTHSLSGKAGTITGHTGQTALSKLQPYLLVGKIIKY